MPNSKVMKKKHNDAVEARKKAKKEKMARIKDILLKCKEEDKPSSIMGWKLDDNNNAVKV